MPTSPDPHLLELLADLVRKGASDLHIVPGYPPTVRRHGRLHASDRPVLTPDQAARLITSITPDNLLAEPAQTHLLDADFSLALNLGQTPARFRANLFTSQNARGACFRHIPDEIPDFGWMGFPQELADRVIGLLNGLVLVTGVTGAGKTTTLAALVNAVNHRGGMRILTLEQPVEYLFPPVADSVITQREVGLDVASFADGLKFGLRQDPDVILVGEIRDIDTARMAISAAETGHLVFATLHTIDAKGALTRLLDLFPRDNQDDIRTQLSLSLRCVISQHLLPNIDPSRKRVLAMEVLTVSDPVRAAIRFGRIESLESAIQTGKKDGMVHLDEDLARLVRQRKVAPDVAARYAKSPQTNPVFRHHR